MEVIFIGFFLIVVLLFYFRARGAFRKVESVCGHSRYSLNVNKELLKINEVMASRSQSLGRDVESWYCLNEAMLEYVTDFCNKNNMNDAEKYQTVLKFLSEFQSFMDLALTSENKVDVINDVAEKLKAKTPMYGMNL
jgi:uncharacterized protein YjaG (DUF416 family)